MKDRGKFERSTGGMKDGKYLRVALDGVYTCIPCIDYLELQV